MRHVARSFGLAVLGIALIIVAVLLLNPSARQLMPVWIYYELIGKRFAPVPAQLEQFIISSGQAYCEVGRDSDCGGYRLVAARDLALDQPARQRGVNAAWCADYVILRRNQGRLTSDIIYWANIPKSMIIVQSSDGHLESSAVEDCRTARLE